MGELWGISTVTQSVVLDCVFCNNIDFVYKISVLCVKYLQRISFLGLLWGHYVQRLKRRRKEVGL